MSFTLAERRGSSHEVVRVSIVGGAGGVARGVAGV